MMQLGSSFDAPQNIIFIMVFTVCLDEEKVSESSNQLKIYSGPSKLLYQADEKFHWSEKGY